MGVIANIGSRATYVNRAGASLGSGSFYRGLAIGWCGGAETPFRHTICRLERIFLSFKKMGNFQSNPAQIR